MGKNRGHAMEDKNNMRKTLVTLVMMICVLGAELAVGQQDNPSDSQLRGDTAKPSVAKRNDAKSEPTNPCSSSEKAKPVTKHAKKERAEKNDEQDQAPQNTVEYGG